MIFDTLGALGGAAGGLLGQLLNYSSAQMTNSTNRRIARENRQWMEKMANTAHQREVEDLRAAGLNPILSATGGAGAAVPSADTSAHQVVPEFGDFGFGSAVKGLSTAYELKKSSAAVELAKSQARESDTASELNQAKIDGQTIQNYLDAETFADKRELTQAQRKRAQSLAHKALQEADQSLTRSNMMRRDWEFENSAYGRALYRMKRTKEAWKNSYIGDIIGTLDSDIQGLRSK